MTQAQAKKRAELYVKNMKLVNKPINKAEFIFDYPGEKEEAELVWYFVDLIV